MDFDLSDEQQALRELPQVEVDSARLLAYRAAWLLSQGRKVSREGAMAKLKGAETYVDAARLGMQLCAGHEFSTESVMSFRWRESIVAPISGGTARSSAMGSPAAWGCGPTDHLRSGNRWERERGRSAA